MCFSPTPSRFTPTPVTLSPQQPVLQRVFSLMSRQQRFAGGPLAASVGCLLVRRDCGIRSQGLKRKHCMPTECAHSLSRRGPMRSYDGGGRRGAGACRAWLWPIRDETPVAVVKKNNHGGARDERRFAQSICKRLWMHAPPPSIAPLHALHQYLSSGNDHQHSLHHHHHIGHVRTRAHAPCLLLSESALLP